MNIGKAIKELRKSQGLTQEELAERSNMTQAALSQIENGKRPGIVTMKKITTALKVPESLIYIAAIEEQDIPADKGIVYEKLFPIIKNLIMQLAGTA